MIFPNTHFAHSGRFHAFKHHGSEASAGIAEASSYGVALSDIQRLRTGASGSSIFGPQASLLIDGRRIPETSVWDEILPQFEARRMRRADLRMLKDLLGAFVRKPPSRGFATYEELVEVLVKRLNKRTGSTHPVDCVAPGPAVHHGRADLASQWLLLAVAIQLITPSAALPVQRQGDGPARDLEALPVYANRMWRQDARVYEQNPLLVPGVQVLTNTTQLPDGRHIYAWDTKSKQIFVHEQGRHGGPWGRDGVKHPDLVAGHDVHAAGVLEVRDGKVVRVDNHSGHYLPTDTILVPKDCGWKAYLPSLRPFGTMLEKLGLAAWNMVLEPVNARQQAAAIDDCKARMERQQQPVNPIPPQRPGPNL